MRLPNNLQVVDASAIRGFRFAVTADYFDNPGDERATIAVARYKPHAMLFAAASEMAEILHELAYGELTGGAMNALMAKSRAILAAINEES